MRTYCQVPDCKYSQKFREFSQFRGFESSISPSFSKRAKLQNSVLRLLFKLLIIELQNLNSEWNARIKYVTLEIFRNINCYLHNGNLDAPRVSDNFRILRISNICTTNYIVFTRLNNKLKQVITFYTDCISWCISTTLICIILWKIIIWLTITRLIIY